jgi:hypothetical protein
MRAFVLVGLVAGCGRLGFGDRTSSDGGSTDRDGSANRDGDVSDAAGPGSDAGGCLATYLLCDGFETATLDPVWTPSASGVSIDSTVAHRGQQSLHVHADAIAVDGAAEAIVTETASFATSPTTFYVRAFIRLSALPADNLGLIEAQQSTGDPSADGLFVTSAGLTLFSQFSEKSRDANFIPADNAWTCAVWSVVRATDTSGSLGLSGDATDTITNVQTDGTPSIDEMDFGIELAGPTDTLAQPAIDVWFDDVIVAASPLACGD